MKSTRCEEVIVQLVVRRYDDAGRPVHELTSQPTKVFRNAQTRDFWAEVDKAVASMNQSTSEPKAEPKTEPKKKPKP